MSDYVDTLRFFLVRMSAYILIGSGNKALIIMMGANKYDVLIILYCKFRNDRTVWIDIDELVSN